MNRTAKILVAVAALSLGGLSAASAGGYTYESTLPRAAVAQHKAYVASLDRAAARKERQAAKAQAAAAAKTDPAMVIGVSAIVTAIIIAAAL